MGKEADGIKFIKLAYDSDKNIEKSDLQKYGRIISDFSYELADIDTSAIKDLEKFLIFLVQKLGIGKAKKVVKNLSSEAFIHLIPLYNLDDSRVFDHITNEIKELSYTKIIELFKSFYIAQVNDKEGIRILTKVTTLLKGLDSILKAVHMQDNYVREIIYNRPHFSFQAKVTSILNASKSSEGTHIIKYGNLFLNTEKDGNITSEANRSGGESRALGLFTGDMRFIDQYELKVLTPYNQELSQKLNYVENHNFYSYDENIFEDQVTAKRKRIINGALFEKLELHNSGHRQLKANIVISSIIKDIFEVRGKISTDNMSSKISIDCEGSIVVNTSLEANTYGVKITVTEGGNWLCPVLVDEETSEVTYQIMLNPSSERCVNIKIQPLLNSHPYADGEITTALPASYEEAYALIQNARKTEFARIKISGDIPDMQKTVDQCIKDLNMLVNYINIDGKTFSYIGAGLPRYSALFGRDSIITALEVFPINPDLAKDTLELLARFQGKSFNDRYAQELTDIKNSNWPQAIKNAAIKGMWTYYTQREEAPGKILHELRIGELANIGAVPHSPYYGTVDATPLWLILFGEYFKWSKDVDFLMKLLPYAESALKWLNASMSEGYLRFIGSMHSKVKIQNQGWKDAGDSIRHILNQKGILSDPEYPIALAEVQGYTYQAFKVMSDIYNQLNLPEKANNLAHQAEELKTRFNKDFWIEGEQFYTMALDKKNEPVTNITSNIGHCLASGIIDESKVRIIEDKIMSKEMYTGWGVRTLGCNCPAYDPISYHNGSVWVHDTAFVGMGLSAESRIEIIKGLFEAANMFEANRLPELFGGFQRKDDDACIQDYPEACSPQAWASASLIWLLAKLIGLKSNDSDIELESTHIPEWLSEISIEGIKLRDKIINIHKIYKQAE